MGRERNRIATAAAVFTAAALLCTPLLAADTPPRLDRIDPQPLKNRVFFFAGGDVARDSFFAWSGVVGAPLVQLHEDGPRFRLMAGTGRYRYRTGAVPSGINEGRIVSGESMLGYRRALGPTMAKAFIGAHVEEQRLAAPDPGHRAQGTAAGIKGALELFHRIGSELFLSAAAAASTVHRSYHARAALARELPSGFAVGAEVAINGDVRYREPRAGLFMQGSYGRTVLALSGGYLSNSDKGGGGYATLSLFAYYSTA
jgi:hypothetical protein